MKIILFSFGLKHGYSDANIVWDVRFLPNPYWEEHLREYTGLKEQVAAYALDNAPGRKFLDELVP
ncbi:MAG: RNase adaptor protein RapZ, partial [Candidatus Electrothrix sp. MAN1_4]|nr:RNase adaptor protein RapZ [Candidatus Electrothrix sp. MAN1_4]